MLELRGVSKVFSGGPGSKTSPVGGVSALHDVNLVVQPGEVVGIVGESGSGKSTLARVVCGLVEPTAGQVLVDGVDLATLSRRERRRLCRRVQIVFQDPNSCLDPRMSVASIISEVWRIHKGLLPRDEESTRLQELLDLVGLDRHHAGRYPHQLSGGQRQRVAIARALASNPEVLICDEAVSALDASVQAQVLNLLADIRQELGLTMLFISHDLAVVRQVSDRVAVMYFGEVIELGVAEDVCTRSAHPYTQALLSVAHATDPTSGIDRIVLTGELPDPSDPPPGCRFQSRCWQVDVRCVSEHPEPTSLREGSDHRVACFFPLSMAPTTSNRPTTVDRESVAVTVTLDAGSGT